MSQLAHQDLKQIPFIDVNALGPTRVITSLCFYVEDDWHTWLFADNKLIKFQMWPAESHYFGDKPEKTSDQSFALLHLLAQHTLTPQMQRLFTSLFSDIQNLAVSLAKCRFFHQYHENKDLCFRRVIATEVEFIVTTCRSMFDLLQELVHDHWAMIRLSSDAPTQQLPKKRFAEVIKGDATASDLTQKYGLTEQFAGWYASQIPFFKQLKSVRDRLLHSGANLEFLYMTEHGMAVPRTQRPFCDFFDWPNDVAIANDLVPLRPVLSTIIRNTIQACDSFAEVLGSHIAVPAPIAPGLQLYSRGDHDNELVSIPGCISESRWCEDA